MNASPNTLSPQERNPQKRHTSNSLAHLDSKVEARLTLKSQFSDDGHDSPENGKDDILKLAKKLDRLKSSRQELVMKMSMGNKSMTIGKDAEIMEVISDRNTKGSPGTNTIYEDRRSHASSAVKSDKNNGEVLNSEDFDFDFDEPEANLPQQISAHNNQKNEPPANTEEGTTTQPMPEVKFKAFGAWANKSTGSGLPIIEGFLKKKSTGLLGLWQKRYYALQDKKLCYYKTQGKELKAGVIDFDLLTVKLEEGNNKKEIKIIPTGGSRIFLLKAVDEKEKQKWFDALQKHIQASKGYSNTLCKVVKMNKYWKDDRITESQFLEQADTGDIILFRTKNVGAQLQRSFTRSEYDHVGIILRYSSGEVVLFEATGKTGVGLCTWKTFVKCKWHLLYHKMVHRKLIIKRSEEFINGIEKFVRYSLGKKYNISAQKLLKKKSVNLDEEDRTFFCSELIAACYKKVNLLPSDLSAATYFPGSFAAEKNLQLLNDAKFSEEYLIDFEI